MLMDVVAAGRCSVHEDYLTYYGKMLLLLLRMALILLLAFSVFVREVDSQTSAYVDEITIGAIFDVKYIDNEALSAFKYAISSQNKKQLDFMLKIEKPFVITMENNFDFIKRMCQLMANGMFAFFTTHTMATIDTIRSYSANFQMPFITTDIAMNMSDQEFGYELYMRPYYVKAIADIIKDKNLKDISYIYDSDEGLERWQQLLEGFAVNGYIVKTHLYRVKNAMDAYLYLLSQHISRSEAATFLLDLPTKDCEEVLQRLDIKVRVMFHHYFVVGLGMEEMSLEGLQKHVVGLRLLDRASPAVRSFLEEWPQMDSKDDKLFGRRKFDHKAALVVDTVSVISRALQRMINEKPTVFKQSLRDGKVYNNGSEGISCDAEPVQSWQHGYDIMKAMRELDFEGLTGPIKFDKLGLRREYRLDVLEITTSQGYEKIGVWDSEIGFYSLPSTTAITTTRIVTTILAEPYMAIKASPHEGNDKYEGYCADLIRLVANRVGFNYTIIPVRDGKFGGKDGKSYWSGMVGELIRHEADIAIAPLTITSEREKVIDFSKPFMYTGTSILMKKPTKDVPSVFSFLKPLSYEIWACIVFAYISVKAVLFLVTRFSRYGSNVGDKANKKKFTVFDCFCINRRPIRSVPGRVLTNVWSFVTIILVSLYTAKLVGFLTTERMKPSIESADDLAKQTETKYGIAQRGSVMEFFQQSTDPVYERMWTFMKYAEPSLFVKSNEEGETRVRNSDNYAFLCDSKIIDYISARHPCDTRKVGNSFNIKGYGIATPHGSDLRDRINVVVSELSESGELKQLETKWWYEKGDCFNEEELSKKQTVGGPLKLRNVAGLFCMLIGCLILGLLILVVERLFKFHAEARIGKKEKTQTEEPIEILE